jgi:hypothetical protein
MITGIQGGKRWKTFSEIKFGQEIYVPNLSNFKDKAGNVTIKLLKYNTPISVFTQRKGTI